MRLLVLGGTWFLGRALVEEAVRGGGEVTTFNRGRSGDDVPGVEVVRGDRTEQASLERLADRRTWDAVIDTSGQVPRIVGQSNPTGRRAGCGGLCPERAGGGQHRHVQCRPASSTAPR